MRQLFFLRMTWRFRLALFLEGIARRLSPTIYARLRYDTAVIQELAMGLQQRAERENLHWVEQDAHSIVQYAHDELDYMEPKAKRDVQR